MINEKERMLNNAGIVNESQKDFNIELAIKLIQNYMKEKKRTGMAKGDQLVQAINLLKSARI